jgi:hypothetical protein
MISKRRTVNHVERRIAYRRRAIVAARRIILLRVLTYAVLAAASAAIWSGIGALVLRLSGIGVLAFGAAMFVATFFSIAVVCNGNIDKEVF